jgi:hypothetical protein
MPRELLCGVLVAVADTENSQHLFAGGQGGSDLGAVQVTVRYVRDRSGHGDGQVAAIAPAISPVPRVDVTMPGTESRARR